MSKFLNCQFNVIQMGVLYTTWFFSFISSTICKLIQMLLVWLLKYHDCDGLYFWIEKQFNMAEIKL